MEIFFYLRCQKISYKNIHPLNFLGGHTDNSQDASRIPLFSAEIIGIVVRAATFF